MAQPGRAELSVWEAEKPKNYFTADPLFHSVLRLSLGERFSEPSALLEQTGALAATRMNFLAVESSRDENLPRLARFDGTGNRVEAIEFHPSYHELGMLVWGTGVLNLLREPGNETLSGALFYLMAHNGEAGHLCPVACTAGAIKLIQQLGTQQQKEKYLPRLLDPEYTQRLHASQFLTEVQGGSDVGSNAAVATRVEGKSGWRISGEKWFCSVLDAGLFVVTARPEGAPFGTKGLGLFLVPRIVDGRINEFSIRRLKAKLGTRSMATGEAEFQGAYAEQIGPLESGFKNVVGIVLDTSRLCNAITACGVMRRAFVEAQTFAQNRKAFGTKILDFPLVRRTLAQMKLQTLASLATTFRILEMSDDLGRSAGSNDLITARRINVGINKYWTSMRCTEIVRSGIEVLGGNGTVEDFSVLPRLYRDSIVLESWEGTHNTLCLQVLRDFAQRQMHLPWMADIRNVLAGSTHSALAVHRQKASELADRVERNIAKLLSANAEDASLAIRGVVNGMCILNEYVCLLRLTEYSLPFRSPIAPELLDYFHLWKLSDDSADSRLSVLERQISAAL